MSTETNDSPVIKSVCECTVCGALADRHAYAVVCTRNPNHYADLNTWLFWDHTHPSDKQKGDR